jgi:hypothetical protein
MVDELNGVMNDEYKCELERMSEGEKERWCCLRVYFFF